MGQLASTWAMDIYASCQLQELYLEDHGTMSVRCLAKVLKQEAAQHVNMASAARVSALEVNMASAARVSALEAVETQLTGVQTDPVHAPRFWRFVEGLLGRFSASVELPFVVLGCWLARMFMLKDKAAFASLDTRLREAAGAAADNTPQVASTQSSALLAIHAVASKKWDDARRLAAWTAL
ncbi:hypothetical protein AK812_SmicGene583 [Symbiodinium microadriaticum]|uniref:Uncharacterized protein n=1 Tax=Symbiodinium microadriaticum TaxID=2951 RepID=A0A1Q9F6A3_SYMMI|nr:hypothetical protein AK812_SmicGene583 [Symbiodinium microadriaticum]